MGERDEPTVTSLIVDKIDATRRELNQRLDAMERESTRRLDAQDKELAVIKQQGKDTNGRVTTLEKARERAQGVVFAYSWVPPALSGVLGAGLTILVMALTGSIHG